MDDLISFHFYGQEPTSNIIYFSFFKKKIGLPHIFFSQFKTASLSEEMRLGVSEEMRLGVSIIDPIR
jgi:hypothetical protein